MSKRDIIKLIKNSDFHFLGIFIVAAIAGIILILSLQQLFVF